MAQFGNPMLPRRSVPGLLGGQLNERPGAYGVQMPPGGSQFSRPGFPSATPPSEYTNGGRGFEGQPQFGGGGAVYSPIAPMPGSPPNVNAHGPAFDKTPVMPAVMPGVVGNPYTVPAYDPNNGQQFAGGGMPVAPPGRGQPYVPPGSQTNYPGTERPMMPTTGLGGTTGAVMRPPGTGFAGVNRPSSGVRPGTYYRPSGTIRGF